MQTWIHFWICIFWLSIALFISNISNLIKLLFYSEIIWTILYCYCLLLSAVNDDIILISSSIFILGLAGLEYSIGIIILLIFKNINKSLDFEDSDNDLYNHNIFTKKNLYINRYIYNN